MSLEFYKILHIFSLSLLFIGFGAMIALKMANSPLSGKPKNFAFITHGTGLLLLLVSGFGMLAKLGNTGAIPGWVYAKIGLWLLFGAGISLLKKRGEIGWPLALFFCSLAASAAYIGIFKPF